MNKALNVFCALLILIAVVSSYHINDCSIQQNVVSSWKEDNITITQYSVTINNHSSKIIKSIHISTDRTFCLKDSTSYWNIERLSNGDLVLPEGTPTISAYSSHTFYFILKGSMRANLYIRSVSY